MNTNPRQSKGAPAVRYPGWVAAYEVHTPISAQVGDKLDISSMHMLFVTSDRTTSETPFPGVGQPNAACANVPGKEKDGGDQNHPFLTTLITVGNTRVLELGDPTWNNEIESGCPVNKIGMIPCYFVTGNEMDLSSSLLTASLSPVVALMQNGPSKDGDEAVIEMLN